MSERGRRDPVRSVVALMVGMMTSLIVAPAQAAAVCSYAGGVASVSMPADGDTGRLTLGTTADAGKIFFGVGDATPVPCGTATVNNTDTVNVSGSDGAQALRLSLAGGPFAPGASTEPDGTSEIEFAVDLGAGEDELTIAGGSAADHIVAGLLGLNLNAGETVDDVDVTVAGVERLDLEGNAGNDALSGGGGDGTGDALIAGRFAVRGGGDDDTLTGGSGNDVLSGGPDADQLDGGDGTDTASYFGAPAAVTASLDSGSASGGDGVDTLLAMENLTGSAFADVLTGDDGDNVLTGLTGDDAIHGLGGSDAAGYLLAASGVTVDLGLGTATGGHGADALDGIENVVGSAFDDVVTGDAATNTLIGGDGNDQLSGAEGNDAIQGGSGTDTLRGGGGNDGLAGQGGNDEMIGGSGNDALRGGGGDDHLLGGTGNDALRGGPMSDVCNGGPGTDQVRSCEG